MCFHWHERALTAGFEGDLRKTVASLPNALSKLLFPSVPYMIVLVLFIGFVFWNGGIVLGACIWGRRADTLPLMLDLYYRR